MFFLYHQHFFFKLICFWRSPRFPIWFQQCCPSILERQRKWLLQLFDSTFWRWCPHACFSARHRVWRQPSKYIMKATSKDATLILSKAVSDNMTRSLELRFSANILDPSCTYHHPHHTKNPAGFTTVLYWEAVMGRLTPVTRQPGDVHPPPWTICKRFIFSQPTASAYHFTPKTQMCHICDVSECVQIRAGCCCLP